MLRQAVPRAEGPFHFFSDKTNVAIEQNRDHHPPILFCTPHLFVLLRQKATAPAAALVHDR